MNGKIAAWRFWIVAGMTAITLFLLVVQETWLEDGLSHERQGMVEWLGPDKADAAHARAFDLYQRWCVESGFVDNSFAMFLPSPSRYQDPLAGSRQMDAVFTWMEGRLRAFWLVIFQMIYRVCLTLQWWPLMILSLVPFLVDALVRRKIKADNFDHASPTLHGLGTRSLLLMPIVYLCLLLAPFALPASLVPLLVVAASAAVWFALSHFVKRA